MDNNTPFIPDWYEKEAPRNSYRSILKWGHPNEFKHPNPHLYTVIKQYLGLKDEDFSAPQEMGLEAVDGEAPIGLSEEQIHAFLAIVGAENLHSDLYSRLRAAYGKGTIDSLRLRKHVCTNLPDAVLAPRSIEEIQQIVAFCHREKIPVTVFGGGSSVTRGVEPVCGGITLDLGKHYNRVVSFNEMDQTITVQSGMFGPALEEILNQAPERLDAKRRYTCGHFPQSFEYSTVGGWVVTKGAGQNSTYYGKIEDIVASQVYVTPAGTIRTKDFPRYACGPDYNQIFLGSEGAFGVLTEVTLKVFRHTPQNRQYFACMFRDWDSAKEAVREIMQAEAGKPSVFRLSDPEETDIALKLYGVEDTPADTLLKVLGYRAAHRCLLLATADGDSGSAKSITRTMRKISTRLGAFDLSPFRVTQRWEKDRWRDPYLREDLADYGIIMDTLECAVTWSKLAAVHSGVRAFIKSRPNTVCMTHLSHAYPQGGNLYFIYIARISDIKEYLELQYGILDAIQKHGGAMSHHHGLGKQTSPWLEEQMGAPFVEILRRIKSYLDPQNILNPGGTLGLDLNENQRLKHWDIQ